VNNLQVFDRQFEKYIPVNILPLSLEHITDFNLFWQPQLLYLDQVDKNWNWYAEYEQNLRDNHQQGYAMEINNSTQGLILLRPNFTSPIHKDQEMLYISLLSSAPWNRQIKNNPQIYQGVGKTMIKFAILQSLKLESQGRLAVHTLKDIIPFYEKLGFINYGADEKHHRFHYLELTL
jgi:hypothetical protein